MIKLIYLLLIKGLIFFLLNQAIGLLNYNLDWVSLLIIFLNSLAFIFVLVKDAKNKKEYLILLLAYIFRILLMLWDIYGREIFILPNSGNDSEAFHYHALAFSSGLGSGRGGMYSTVVGIIYSVFGPQRIVAQYFNVLLGMYSIITINKIMNFLKINSRIQTRLLIFVSFMPTLAILSSILKRESIITALVTVSLLYFLKWIRTGKLNSFLFAIFLPVVAATFHSGAVAMTLAYMVYFIIYDPKKNTYDFSVKTFMALTCFIGLFFLVNHTLGEFIFGKFDIYDTMEDVIANAGRRARGGSAYLVNMQATGLGSMIIYTPIRMFYFLFSPFPWDWRGINDILSFFTNSIIYILAVYYAIKSLKIKNKSHNELVALLIITTITVMMFAWGVSNTGTAMRHRSKYIAIYMITLGISLEQLNESKITKVEQAVSISLEQSEN